VRTLLAAGTLGAALLTALVPAAPATAYCDSLTSIVTGGCSNPCTVAAYAYDTAHDRSRGVLPEAEFICFA
jgi:hypothetical protein